MLNALLHELLDAGEAGVVGVDELLGDGLVHPLDAAGKPEGADAVDDAEVDRFGLARCSR